MKFSELTDEQKRKARERHTSEGYLDYDWWDFVYDDIIEQAKILGITISSKGKHGHELHFSGFYSQGDGLSFAGRYKFAPDAVAKMHDSTLASLAERLQVLNLARRLLGKDYISGSIGDPGRSHNVSFSMDDDEDFDISEEGDVQEIMEDFASWAYKQLEQEYEWLHSNECVDERLNEEEFDEEGEIQ